MTLIACALPENSGSLAGACGPEYPGTTLWSLAAATLLAVLGRGLLNRRPWARRIALWASIATAIAVAILAIHLFAVLSASPGTGDLGRYVYSKLPESLLAIGHALKMMLIYAVAAVLAMAMIASLAVVWLLNLKSVRADFAAAATRPASTPQ